MTMYSAMVDQETTEFIGSNTEHFFSISPLFYSPKNAKMLAKILPQIKFLSYNHNYKNFNFMGEDNCGTHKELFVINEFLHLMQTGTFNKLGLDWTVRKMGYV